MCSNSLWHLHISNFKNTVILYVICAPCNLIKVTLHAVNHHVLTARLHICSYEIPCGRRSRDRRAYDKRRMPFLVWRRFFWCFVCLTPVRHKIVGKMIRRTLITSSYTFTYLIFTFSRIVPSRCRIFDGNLPKSLNV